MPDTYVLLQVESHTTMTLLLYVFFWVISWRMNFICRRFGTLCLLHLHRQVGKQVNYD